MQKKNTKNFKTKKKTKKANNNNIKGMQMKQSQNSKKTEIIYTSDIIAEIIFDKILTNVFTEIKSKELDKLSNIFSSNKLIILLMMN